MINDLQLFLIKLIIYIPEDKLTDIRQFVVRRCFSLKDTFIRSLDMYLNRRKKLIIF